MKKIITFLMICCLTLGLAACGSSSDNTASSDSVAAGRTNESGSNTSTNSKDTLTVGFDQNFPPFGYVEQGEYVGFDIDLARECAKRMGKELVLVPIDWNSKDLELDTGNIDCIWNGFTMNGREDQYTWTDSYMDNSQVVVVRKDSGITSLDDLAGKVVEVQMDSSAEAALEDEENKALTDSFGSLMSTGEYETAFMDLESGAVDAIAIDIGVANFKVAGKEDTFIILDEQISTEQYGVGFKLGNTELRDEVQTALLEMVEDGTFAEISIKWFEYDVCTLK